MNYPCGVIRDLLPLYIEDMCTAESRTAIELHLAQCTECREYLEKMRSDDLPEICPAEEEKLAGSLKNVKRKINRKMMRMAVAAGAMVLLIVSGVYALFELPLKELGPEELAISAQVYPMEELVAGEAQAGSVQISVSENDEEYVQLEIPEMSNAQVSISSVLADRDENLTVITKTSLYHIREILFAYPDGGSEDTIYIDAIRTTLLNNKAPESLTTSTTMQFKEINKIVYLHDNGDETVLWSR